MSKTKFIVGAVTDVGLQRVNNEDNFFVPTIPVKSRNKKVFSISTSHPNGLEIENTNAFFAVCDGMGGHNAGEYASYAAVSSIEDKYEKLIRPNRYDGAIEKLNDFFGDVNHHICEVSAGNPDMRGMGCTICGLYFFGSNRFMPVNIGDSRVYMVKGSKLVQLSVDHSDSDSKKGNLTRYLGMPEEYGDVTGEFGVKAELLTQKTRFLLCSDGLTDMVEDADILHHLKTEKNPMAAAEKLVDVAKKMGGIDNVTTVVIDAIPKGDTIARTLRKPAIYCIAAAILAAAGGGYGYYQYNIDKQMSESFEGVSLDNYNEQLANAKSAEEILAVIEGDGGLLSAIEKNLNDSKGILEQCKNAGMNAADYSEYADLEKAIGEFESEISDLKTRLAEIKQMDGTNPEKSAGLEKIKTELSEGGSIYQNNEKLNEMSKSANAALNAKKKSEASKPKSDGASNKPSNGGSSSGGSSSKSGGGSSSGGSSSKSSGGSSSGGSSSKSSGGSSSKSSGGSSSGGSSSKSSGGSSSGGSSSKSSGGSSSGGSSSGSSGGGSGTGGKSVSE